MEESLTPITVSKPENKCSDCLYITLEGNLIQQQKQSIFRPFQPKQATSEKISLHLLINFSAQWQSLGVGRIKFGLKGGELKLKLTNCKIPYEDRRFVQPLDVSVQKERQDQKGNKTKTSIEPSWNDGKAKAKVKLGTEQTENRADKFQITPYQISSKGSEVNPIWEFKVETGEPFLEGTLGKEELGILTVSDKPCFIEATFEVSQRDVEFIEAEGLWLKNIIPEQRTALDIALVKRLLKHKLTPYLSRVELQYV
jgi:hypothetical protein